MSNKETNSISNKIVSSNVKRNTILHINVIWLFTFSALLFSCSQKKISYNPFLPNEGIKLKTILKEGFSLSFAEETFCYDKDFENMNMFFYYNPDIDEIVGEGYYFYLDSIYNISIDITKSVIEMLDVPHDFNKVKPEIETILEKFYGGIISPPSYLGASKDLYFFAGDSVYHRIILCRLIYDFSDRETIYSGREAIYIENFYPIKTK